MAKEKTEKQEVKTASAKGLYQKDTKRYHSYMITSEDGITGSIYVPKAGEVPKTITLTLQSE